VILRFEELVIGLVYLVIGVQMQEAVDNETALFLHIIQCRFKNLLVEIEIFCSICNLGEVEHCWPEECKGVCPPHIGLYELFDHFIIIIIFMGSQHSQIGLNHLDKYDIKVPLQNTGGADGSPSKHMPSGQSQSPKHFKKRMMIPDESESGNPDAIERG